MKITRYEQQQIDAINAWHREPPGAVGAAFEFVTAPTTWLVTQCVPVGLVQQAIESADSAGRWLADSADLKQRAGVASLDELRKRDLQLSDRLAGDVHQWALGIAAAEGFAAGAGGVATIMIDIPAVMTLALRTIYRIGACYGYALDSTTERDIALGILAAAGASHRAQKRAALETIRTLEAQLATQVWEAIAEDTVERRVVREGGLLTARVLGRRIGRRLIQRKLLQLAPFIGAAVGMSASASFINDVAWAARRVFQERWLIENRKAVRRPRRAANAARHAA